MKILTKEQIAKWGDALNFVEKLYVDTRKGVPQTKYVLEMTDNEVFTGEKFELVPEDLRGLWMQRHEDDNTDISWEERVGLEGHGPRGRHLDFSQDFIKVRAVEVTTIDYQPED